MEIVLLLMVVIGWLVVRGMDRDEARRRFAGQEEELRRLREEVLSLRRTTEQGVRVSAPEVKNEIVPEEVTIRPAAYVAPVVVVKQETSAAYVRPTPVARAVGVPPVLPRIPVAPPPPPPVVNAVVLEPEKRSLESKLGVDWLSRLGIVLVVFGVAFGLAWEVTHLGPAGRVAMAYAVSLLFLGGGLWLERMERYRIFARAGIGGGWALGFLTTYAMYFFPATQVLRSQAVDLVLLFAVGVGMVLHSLRYRSQVVTGLAFLLAFSTVTISQVTPFSLLASAVLALGLEFVCVREEWYGLEIAGVLAAYGNHFLWLDRVLDQAGGPGHPFPLWGESTALLILFWAIFRAGYCIRKPSTEAGEGMSGLVAVLNSAGVLGLMKYQSFHPELAFRALLGLGLVELALAFVMRTRRRPAFAVLVTIASVLLIAAIPFGYGGVTWPLLWVLEGEALFVCGVLLRERVMRWLSILAHLLVVVQMMTMHGLSGFAAVPTDWRVTTTFFVVAAAMWINAEWLARKDEEEVTPYRVALWIGSFAAAWCAVVGFWIWDPGWTLVLVWGGLALALVETGLRARSLPLRMQGYGVLFAALVRLALVNFAAAGTRGMGDLRMWAGLGVMAACVVVHERLRMSSSAREEERGAVSDVAMWCASALAMTVLYFEVPAAWLAVAWVALALGLLEVGIRERSIGTRAQAYLALVSGLAWLYLRNFADGGQAGWGDPRLWAGVGVVAGCLLLLERMGRASELLVERELWAIGGAILWCASALVSTLLYLELPAAWLAAGWAGFALVLAAAALVRDGARLRSKAILLALMACGRGLAINLGNGLFSGNGPWSLDWTRVAFLSAVALLAAAVPLGFLLRRKAIPERGKTHWMSALLRRPEQIFFFTALALLVAWIPVEFHKGAITMGWSALGVAVFLVALAAGERSFRLAGLGVLLLGVAKLLVVDIWSMEPIEKYPLLVGVGVTLIAVSFLYSRFGERLKEYL